MFSKENQTPITVISEPATDETSQLVERHNELADTQHFCHYTDHTDKNNWIRTELVQTNKVLKTLEPHKDEWDRQTSPETQTSALQTLSTPVHKHQHNTDAIIRITDTTNKQSTCALLKGMTTFIKPPLLCEKTHKPTLKTKVISEPEAWPLTELPPVTEFNTKPTLSEGTRLTSHTGRATDYTN
jgi:hypothetical protein